MKYPEILSIQPEPAVTSYTDKDTMLYALGIGMGADPLNPEELPFVYEKDLRTVPTMSTILAIGSDKFIVEGEINFLKIVHGEQRLRVHNPLPPEGSIRTQARCLSVVDKGKDKGALVNIEVTISDAVQDVLYSTIISTIYCRGDGGFGGPSEGALVTHETPSGPPEKEVLLTTRADQAALYRLSGDRNPLHIDPEIAVRAGFKAPILHGLCTYGVACRAVMQAYCGFDPSLIKAFDARFSSPVFPGETIVTKLWKNGQTVSFECGVAERDVTVLKHGRCELAQ